jgi:putative transposase
LPGPQPLSITVSAAQRALLERLARAQTTPQALARRARIILLAAEGHQNEPIAEQLGCNRIQVREWRRRWAEASPRLEALEGSDAAEAVRIQAISEVLSDRARSGRPSRFTAEQVCQILALACEDPSESGREVTHWTPRELAQEAQKRGIVESISVRTVGRFFDRPR